jgi:hypothetical protein
MKHVGSLSYMAWLAGQHVMFPEVDDFDNSEIWKRLSEKEKEAWEASISVIIEAQKHAPIP